MTKEEIYISIAAFAILLVGLVWFGLRTYLSLRHDRENRAKKREEMKKRFTRK